MTRALQRSMAAALGVAFVLASVLAGGAQSIVDRIPGDLGGLPAGTPARPTTPFKDYPAVHDMPPPRSTTPLSEEEQYRLEKEMEAIRDRQEKQTGTDKKSQSAAKKAAPGAKTATKTDKDKDKNKDKNNKKLGDSGSGQAAGAKTNP
jgi:hypothetical protein